MPTRKGLYGVVAAVAILFAGATAFVFWGTGLLPQPQLPLAGTLIGSLLGITASTFVWYLTHWKTEREKAREKQNFRKALWTDLGSLRRVLYEEAEWWRAQVAQNQYAKTESRLFIHLKSALLSANLVRVAEMPGPIADCLITFNADTTVLQEVTAAFYPNEDKLFEHEQEGRLTASEAARHVQTAKTQIHSHLMRVAARANQAVELLDSDESFEKERRASFSPAQWTARDQYETQMRTALKAFYRDNMDDPAN